VEVVAAPANQAKAEAVAVLVAQRRAVSAARAQAGQAAVGAVANPLLRVRRAEMVGQERLRYE
tara:strand:- start:512 stop:700 length:189 start_codon:yes stop_codon:yes gene_type:complete